MKKLFLLPVFCCTLLVSNAQGQGGALIDTYAITEMYKVDMVEDTTIAFGREFYGNYLMVRMQYPDKNKVVHNVSTLDIEKTLLLAYGSPVDCVGLTKDDEIVSKRICYDGAVAGKFFEHNDGALFIFEQLKSPPEHKDDGREFVAFTFVFLPWNLIQLYGYKTSSNYDPLNENLKQ